MNPRLAALFAAALLAAGASAPAAVPRFEPIDRNLYEWCAVAPTVVSARIVEFDGRWAVVDVERSLRGDLREGDRIRIDRRTANRARGSQAAAVDLDVEARYVLLLTPSPRGRPEDPPSFDLVRGVRGVRVLPPEGSAAVLEALATFVEIQDLGDYAATWNRSRELLGAVNPLVLETVLEQYAKFRRGTPDLLPVLLPLLDHPRASIRSRTAWLVGQILDELASEDRPEAAATLPAVISRARRDPDVDVRVAATEALGALRGPSTTAVLEEIADDDPDQAVRYTAERLLLERRGEASRAAAPSD